MDITGMSGKIEDEQQQIIYQPLYFTNLFNCRPIREDLPAAQGPAHLQEEDSCQEKNTQPSLQ